MFFLAALTFLLLRDHTGLYRISLLCCLLHEGGHLAVYILRLKKVPRLHCSLWGICFDQPDAFCCVLAVDAVQRFLLGMVLCGQQPADSRIQSAPDPSAGRRTDDRGMAGWKNTKKGKLQFFRKYGTINQYHYSLAEENHV